MKILICGVGAIGSNLTARLAADLKGEHEITVLDKDTVEERNIIAGTQFYTEDQIGLPKVEALQYNIYKHYSREIEILHEEFNGTIQDWDKYDLTLDCFDNHDARRLIQLYYDVAHDLHKPVNVLHAGFSDTFTFAVEWAENYHVPDDITSGMDICEMPGASAFVNMVAGTAALVAENYVWNDKKIDILGGRYTHTLVK